jgi:S1-C subfamily serine protease
MKILTCCCLLAVTLPAATAQRQNTNLESRFQKLSCAIVQIKSDTGAGTGFFISADGRVATAAHVVTDSSYSISLDGKQINLTLTARQQLRIVGSDGKESPVQLSLAQPDIDRASADVAVFDSRVKPPCFVQVGESKNLRVGQHLIAIGYPSLSPTEVLYDGFLSARHQHLPIPIGHIGTKPIYPTYDVLRIQMPVTPGASGSPVFDEKDFVVGIISEVPVLWSTDLDKLVNTFATNTNGSGVLLSGFDTTKLLAQLSWIVHEFESPGAGLAVPSSYLLLESNATQTHQSTTH